MLARSATWLAVAAIALGCAREDPPAGGDPAAVTRGAEGAPRLPIVVRSEGDEKWAEWTTGVGPPGRQASLPINHPPVVPADKAYHMRDEDPVVGVLLEGHARAYPWWILSNGHLANDMIAGEPVVVSMCERCSGVSAFRATLDGQMLDFRLGGIHKGTWFARDYQTDSFWHPFTMKAWKGPLEGRRLERVRTYQATWAEWRRDHPDSTVVLGSEEVRYRQHSRWGDIPKHPGASLNLDPERLRSGEPNPRSDWLRGHEMMFGLISRDGESGKAYPLARIRATGGMVQEEFDGRPVVLLVQGDFQVGAYLRRLGSRRLELRVVSIDPLLVEDQDGTRWDLWGRAVAGPSQGSELALADGYLTEWYEWIQSFPETELFAQPRPGA